MATQQFQALVEEGQKSACEGRHIVMLREVIGAGAGSVMLLIGRVAVVLQRPRTLEEEHLVTTSCFFLARCFEGCVTMDKHPHPHDDASLLGQKIGQQPQRTHTLEEEHLVTTLVFALLDDPKAVS